MKKIAELKDATTGIECLNYYLYSYCQREDKQGFWHTPTHKQLALDCYTKALEEEKAENCFCIILEAINKASQSSEFFKCLQRMAAIAKLDINSKEFLIYLVKTLPGLSNLREQNLPEAKSACVIC